MPSIHDPVSKLHLLKPEHEKLLGKLSVKTIGDLIDYYPRGWQDLSEIKTISDVRPGELINIRARVKSVSAPGFPFRRVKITEALLEDSTGNVVAVWFNQPYIKNSLRAGQEYYFSGKGQIYKNSLQLSNPTFEMVKEDPIHVAGIIPVYQLTEGITQKQIRYWLKQSLTALTDKTDLIPQTIRTRLKLADLNFALNNIHFPSSESALKIARRTLAFDELFCSQLAFQSYKKTLQSLPAPKIPFNKPLVSKFVAGLPFQLTNSQRLALWEILRDMNEAHPMNRLLEGEVGSGKTVVAGIAMFEAAEVGYQSVLLAPTEILAMQHYETLNKLFGHSPIEIALLTRSHKTTSETSPLSPPHEEGLPPQKGIPFRGTPGLGEVIATGKIKIIVGTHALLQEHVNFKNIGLLVVDEQHRFGVRQRAKLAGHGQIPTEVVPHLLSMTATPIPRTLALAFYGDLDISKLAELPSGRHPIITKLVRPDGRDIAYKFVRQELKKGYQMYVVVPLVDSSTRTDADLKQTVPDERKSVSSEAEKLRQIFPEFTVGTLHGRMTGEEKKQIMADFSARSGNSKIDILVSTTVIEVGVDVANATVMIIENAERFGLSQLHQLRGRVGRSSLQSYCLLFAESQNETTKKRLEAVVKSTDGFELAEIDLKLRGSGELLGTQQSGFVPFRIASLSDEKLIAQAKSEALSLLAKDPKLENYAPLKNKVAELTKQAHLE